jgi:hypothetical protein
MVCSTANMRRKADWQPWAQYGRLSVGKGYLSILQLRTSPAITPTASPLCLCVMARETPAIRSRRRADRGLRHREAQHIATDNREIDEIISIEFRGREPGRGLTRCDGPTKHDQNDQHGEQYGKRSVR